MAKILCIDDEDYIREDICEFLESVGHTLFQAGDGREGLEIILKLEPDIVFCDITMPNMDGFELLAELRKNHLEFADMPFIFLSALADRTDVLEGMKLGADDYLTKPIDFEMLANRVEASLRQVDRMNAKKDQQFVKLFNALSGSGASDQETTEPVVADQSQPGTKPDTQQKVYGTIFRFENCENQLISDGRKLVSWLEERSLNFLQKVLPKSVSLTKVPFGGILICFQHGDVFKVAKEAKRLAKKLEEHLKIDHFDELVRITTVSKDLLYDLLTISRSDYELVIDKEDLNDPDRFLATIKELIDAFFRDEDMPEKLAESIKQSNSCLSPLVLLTQEGAMVPITFFDQDEKSRQKIKSSFALFNAEKLEEAKFQVDLMFLEQLSRDIKKYNQVETTVVDVHFETLLSGDRLTLYLTNFIKLTESLPSRILINVIGFPAGQSNRFLCRILAPFGDYAERRIVQVSPRTIEAHANSDILVAGITLSYFDLVRSQLEPSFLLKAKRRLSRDGILLILRGLPSKKEMAQFSRYRFDGYAVASSAKP